MKEKERGKCVLFQNQASLKLKTHLLVRNLSLNNKTNCVILKIMLKFFAGKKDIAIDMYKKGIIELEKGIAIDVGYGQGKFL
jgi:hypothetical protein